MYLGFQTGSDLPENNLTQTFPYSGSLSETLIIGTRGQWYYGTNIRWHDSMKTNKTFLKKIKFATALVLNICLKKKELQIYTPHERTDF